MSVPAIVLACVASCSAGVALGGWITLRAVGMAVGELIKEFERKGWIKIDRAASRESSRQAPP